MVGFNRKIKILFQLNQRYGAAAEISKIDGKLFIFLNNSIKYFKEHPFFKKYNLIDSPSDFIEEKSYLFE